MVVISHQEFENKGIWEYGNWKLILHSFIRDYLLPSAPINFFIKDSYFRILDYLCM